MAQVGIGSLVGSLDVDSESLDVGSADVDSESLDVGSADVESVKVNVESEPVEAKVDVESEPVEAKVDVESVGALENPSDEVGSVTGRLVESIDPLLVIEVSEELPEPSLVEAPELLV